MDFSKADIIPILRSSMPCRFSDMPPRDFELFVAQFLQDVGFNIEAVKHGSDYGIDIVATNDDQRLGVQVKRYAKQNKVGVKDVNQIVGGSNFYDCEKTLFITTSDFTRPARRLAKKNDVELWDWNQFQKRLSDTYLKGMAYQEYFEMSKPKHEASSPLTASLKTLEKTPMKGNFDGALFYIGISNTSNKNIPVEITGASYITKTNNQYAERAGLEGYFNGGVIYAGCTVEACRVFDMAQLRRTGRGDKLLLNLLADDRNQSVMLKLDNSHLNENKSNKTGSAMSEPTKAGPAIPWRTLIAIGSWGWVAYGLSPVLAFSMTVILFFHFIFSSLAKRDDR